MLEGLCVETPDGDAVLRVERAACSGPLLKAVATGRLGEVRVDGLQIDSSVHPSGAPLLALALDRSLPAPSPSSVLPAAGSFLLGAGDTVPVRVRLQVPQAEVTCERAEVRTCAEVAECLGKEGAVTVQVAPREGKRRRGRGGRLRLSASLVGRHCTASVDGTYDAGARRLELDSPAELALGVSARLGRLALGLLNPLVGEAAELEGGGMVQMRVTSPEGQLPADRLQVSVDPSSFRMRSPLIGGLLRLLRHQLGGASGAGGAPRAAAGPGAAPAPRAPALFVRLSAFDAELERDGDVRFGPVGVEVAGTPGGGGGLDFSLAGTSAAGEVDMDVAVPAAALRSVARRPNLPDSACLTVPVRGSPPHLQVDWAAALGRLTALLLTSAAPPSGGGP